MAKQTAGKAHAASAGAALTPILLWVVGTLTGAIEAPPDAEVQTAFGVLAMSAISGTAAWFSAYYKRNYPK